MPMSQHLLWSIMHRITLAILAILFVQLLPKASVVAPFHPRQDVIGKLVSRTSKNARKSPFLQKAGMDKTTCGKRAFPSTATASGKNSTTWTTPASDVAETWEPKKQKTHSHAKARSAKTNLNTSIEKGTVVTGGDVENFNFLATHAQANRLASRANDVPDEIRRVLKIRSEDVACSWSRIFFRYDVSEKSQLDNLQHIKSLQRISCVVVRNRFAWATYMTMDKKVLGGLHVTCARDHFETRLAKHIVEHYLDNESGMRRLVSALQCWRHFQPGMQPPASFKVICSKQGMRHALEHALRETNKLSMRVLASKLGEILLDRETITKAVHETQILDGSNSFTNGVDASLTNPDFELHLQINDEEILVTLPILREASAALLDKLGLKEDVCWAMAKTAKIQKNDLILDPMCGKGSLLFVAAGSWGDSGQKFVGWDINGSQIKTCDHNVKLRKIHDLADVACRKHMAKVSGQPSGENELVLENQSQSCFYFEHTDTALQERSVTFFEDRNLKANVVLCDLPWGRGFGSIENNQILYPEFCNFLLNILDRENGRFVIITSSDNVKLLTDSLLRFKQDIVIVERRALQLFHQMDVSTCIFSGRIRSEIDKLPEGFVPNISKVFAWEPREGRKGWLSERFCVRKKMLPFRPAQSKRAND